MDWFGVTTNIKIYKDTIQNNLFNKISYTVETHELAHETCIC